MENKEIISGVLQGQESCSFRMMANNCKYICRINKEGRKGDREEGGKEGGDLWNSEMHFGVRPYHQLALTSNLQ